SARLALTGLAHLAVGALVVAGALGPRHARVVRPALLAARALPVLVALDALVVAAHERSLAVLVGFAAGALRLAAARDREHERRDRHELVHGVKPKWTQHVSQIW